MSEEKKAVDEEIRNENIRLAMIEAWRNKCLEPHYCAASMLPSYCPSCGWVAKSEQARIEQVIDENS
jgi:hypothetical protein